MTRHTDSFKHTVGRSTLTQGVTVRRDYEAWFDAPARGESREVALLFANQEVTATLRRLANESGSVQIRYQSKRQGPLREWLQAAFSSSDEPLRRAILEFRKAATDSYRLVPMIGDDLERLRLCVGPTLYHNNSEALARGNVVYPEIPEVVESVASDISQGQTYYNAKIKAAFVQREWEPDRNVVPELPLRCDFRKADLQVEVEFGNARSYYQDYLKFLLPFTRGMIRIGVLMVPTSDFARLLCMAGTRRALDRATQGGERLSRTPKYSGMITYEKVEREFEPLRFILNMPLVILGLDFWGHGEAASPKC